VTGIAAALASAVLWIYHVHPQSRLLGRYSAEVAGGGQLAEQLTALAAVLGLMAILSSIATSSGGGGYFLGLVLGLVGLSYPLLTWLDVVSGPLRPGFLD
jgi:drug/metabolite transporter (DMT)-like permease